MTNHRLADQHDQLVLLSQRIDAQSEELRGETALVRQELRGEMVEWRKELVSRLETLARSRGPSWA